MEIGEACGTQGTRGLPKEHGAGPARFTLNDVHGQFQIDHTTRDIGVPIGSVRMAIALMVHRPDLIAHPNEVIHHGIGLGSFHLQIKHRFG